MNTQVRLPQRSAQVAGVQRDVRAAPAKKKPREGQPKPPSRDELVKRAEVRKN